MRASTLAWVSMLAAACGAGFSGCGDSADESASNPKPDGGSLSEGGGWPDGAAGDAADATGDQDAAGPEPQSRAPCKVGDCYTEPSLNSACGSSTITEDFHTQKHSVHEYPLLLPAGAQVDLTLKVTGGSWTPALIVNASDGTTLYDGEVGATGSVRAKSISTGEGETTAHATLTAAADTSVSVFVTSWEVIYGGFVPFPPADATYSLTTDVTCDPPAPGDV